MCGNGDLLGFMLNAKNNDKSPRQVEGYRGPVITSRVRIEDGDIGAYIQDAGFPQFASWLAETAKPTAFMRRGTRVLWSRLMGKLRREWNPRLAGDLKQLLGPGTLQAGSANGNPRTGPPTRLASPPHRNTGR